LTRFFDREAFRLEEMAEQVALFKRKLRWLFAEQGCLNLGFTSLALAHLARNKLVPVPGQAPVVLGGRGSADRVLAKCLGHMVAWSNLASEVATTEFPEFELLACFQVFRLLPVASPAAAVPKAQPAVAEQLKCLADAFKVDTANLVEQFMEHQRIAQAEMARAPGDPASSAWQRALQKTQSSSRRRRAFQANALVALLQRFVVAPGSTAGIEQNFSLFKRSLGEHWQGTELAEERRLVLQLSSAAAPVADNELLAEARLIWASGFAPPRKGGGVRLDRQETGKPRHVRIRTAAAWLRRRRQDVADGAAATPVATVTDAAVDAAAEAAWTAKHEKELRFQTKARTEHQKAAVQQGVLSQDALGAGAEQQMADYRAQVQSRECKLEARQRFLDRAQQQPVVPDLRGCQVFVDDAARSALNATPAQWALARRQAKLVVVEDRAVASVFVTLTPSQPGDRTQCVAALSGAVICTPEMILTSAGVALKLQRAMSWPRHIFLSARCYDRHQAMVDLVRRVCSLAQRTCRWTWYLEADGPERQAIYLSRAQKRQAAHRSELVTLLAPGQGAAFEAYPNRMSLHSFLAGVHRVDTQFTQLGFCGR
jgi:hypothetical protein